MPDCQQELQSLKMASASSRVTSFRLLNFMKSSREVITLRPLGNREDRGALRGERGRDGLIQTFDDGDDGDHG